MTDEAPEHPANEERRESTINRLLTTLLRLFLVMLAGAAVGVIFYLAYIFIIRELVTQPTTEFRQAFSISETRQALARERVDEKLSDYNERIAVLESSKTIHSEALDELQSYVRELQTSVEDQTLILDRIATLEASLEELLAQQDEMNQRIGTSEAEIEELQAGAQAVETMLTDASPADLLKEVRLLYALELLDRSRIYILQNNLGMAEQDILMARDLLVTISDSTDAGKQTRLEDWAERLESIANSLPQSPRLASINLETVWSLMVLGLDADEMESTPVPLEISTISAPQEPAAGQATPSETPAAE